MLGVFIDGVLGNSTEAPPVTIPEPGSDLSPGIGYPIPVREDGTISLPLIDPIAVRGLTVAQVEQLVPQGSPFQSGEYFQLQHLASHIWTDHHRRHSRYSCVLEPIGAAKDTGQRWYPDIHPQGRI